MPKTCHSGKLSELPMISKKEAASNGTRRMEIIRSRRIQTRYLPMTLKEISQVKLPGQNQAIKIIIARMWDCYIPISEKFLCTAFLATDIEGDAFASKLEKMMVQTFEIN
ncbi:hypothetical protein DsansV1_C08g0086361 [Dioscorea sansibarensis]